MSRSPDWLDKETRGISPVIGVILLVAITAILAAVIGTFVLDFGGEVGETGPVAAVSVEDADEDVDTSRSQFIIIEHDGGDPIHAEDLKIVVRYDSNGTPVGTWEDGSWDAKGQDNFDIDGATGYNNGIDYNGGTLSTGDVVSVGDRLTWYLDDDPGSSTSPGIEANTEYRIVFIDTKTQNTIVDVTVTIK